MAKKKPSPADAARALRADARYAEVFNSGLEVWLYDATHRAELKASRAFEVETDDTEMERQMLGFVARGTIAAYQLMQDDSLSVAVAVGAPLTQNELSVARWNEPQQAFLRVPSGRLVLESNDALTIREEEPTDKGVELSVPPGDYLLTLYRIDHDALETDRVKWRGPNEFIVLTPGAAARPVSGQPAFLPWNPPGPSGTATWALKDGAYEGVALVYDAVSSIVVKLSPADGAKLGLVDCALAKLSVPALKLECVLVHLVGDTTKFEFFSRQEKVKLPREHAGGEWAFCWFQPEGDELFCMRQDGRLSVTRKLQKAWHPATLRVLEGRALEKKG